MHAHTSVWTVVVQRGWVELDLILSAFTERSIKTFRLEARNLTLDSNYYVPPKARGTSRN